MGRIQPAMPAAAYKTYRILAPANTHFRKATCAETNCPHYLNGWQVRVEGLDPVLLHAARNSGRRYVEQHVREGETWLVFEAGQSCFQVSQHRIRLDKPELYLVRGGDWRGNPTGEQRQHASAADWVEDFGEHQQQLSDEHEKG
ncbi:hypothetical protein BX265_6191 [Streptomyces sp. TLI_235]|nr:hypothetical protein [Streptomyces sp. TLI_235]PBC71581.1 hypothetical protein BX265_6191 [Streptomyces sp. TLI_235]